MSHIIGRPNEDLLEVMLGHGADPEQAIIGGSEQGLGAAALAGQRGRCRPLPGPGSRSQAGFDTE